MNIKKDEFILFLNNTGLKEIYNSLSTEEKEQFKQACYVGVSFGSDGSIESGHLITFRDKDKLLYIISANLIYRQQYELALKILDEGIKLANDRETLAQYHIEYALAYEKMKDIKNCNYHCEKAVELLHHGTYAYERLIKNYVKAKDYQNALRICDTVLERQEVFNESTWKRISEYANKRKAFILKQIDKKQ